MNDLNKVLYFVFTVVGALSVVFSVVLLIRDIIRYRRSKKIQLETASESLSKEEVYESYLQTISNDINPANKASAFVMLMIYKYVLVNVISNEGNKYCDSNQLKSMRDSLKNGQIIARLNEVEGYYE